MKKMSLRPFVQLSSICENSAEIGRFSLHPEPLQTVCRTHFNAIDAPRGGNSAENGNSESLAPAQRAVQMRNMVEIDVEYQGHLKCTATHRESGVALHTDAPRDNQGEGSTFSPTDLLATALGTCMLTIMGIAARRLEVDLTGARATVTKEMTAAPVRRVGTLAVRIHAPAHVASEHRLQLERAALACPVHRSLHPDLQIPVEFRWE